MHLNLRQTKGSIDPSSIDDLLLYASPQHQVVPHGRSPSLYTHLVLSCLAIKSQLQTFESPELPLFRGVWTSHFNHLRTSSSLCVD